MRVKTITHQIIRCIIFTVLVVCTSRTVFATNRAQVSIITDLHLGLPAQHGINKLLAALQQKNIITEQPGAIANANAPALIVAGIAGGNGMAADLLKQSTARLPQAAQALTVWKTVVKGKTAWVFMGSDELGLMYALLDAAQRIEWSSNQKDPFIAFKNITEQPEVNQRAISIYTMNKAYWESRLYDENYWIKYLDVLAENRFNSLVIIFGYENGGFLAPCYPYFFDTENFPGVKMVGITAEQQQKNLAAFNRIITLAHERGIAVTTGIWDHIYRGGVQGGGLANTRKAPDQPVPNLVWGLNENNLVLYTKAALEKFIRLMPGLDAIQFRLHDESGLKKEEQLSFWLDVFKMIKENYPKMHLDLRAKELPEAVLQGAIDIGVNFRITTKYWMEQMGLPFHPTQINPEKSPRRHSYSDLLRYPQQYKMHWRLWNGGTSRILLWGSPAYVKRFAATTHLYDGDGFEVNEPLATKMEAQPHDASPFNLLTPAYKYYDYEFERYWYFFKSFGRVGYSAKTETANWQKEFTKRFGEKSGPLVQQAVDKASWILPRIVTSCYPYSQFPTTRGWAEMQYMGSLAAYAKADITDIRQFTNFDEEAQLIIEKGETPKMLQSANSRWFVTQAEEISRLLLQAQKNMAGSNKEFIATAADLKILCGLSMYYGHRIPAAIYYRVYSRTKNIAALDSAIAYEAKAMSAWQQIVDAAGDVYSPDIMMGLREANLCGHWRDALPALQKDLSNLRTERGALQPSTNTNNIHYNVLLKPAAKIFTTDHVPVKTAVAGKPIAISIKVHANAGVKWVRLRYRSVSQEEEYKTMAMLPATNKDVYIATVPAGEINTKWDFMYFIELMDNNGHGRIYPDFNEQTPYYFVKLIRP